MPCPVANVAGHGRERPDLYKLAVIEKMRRLLERSREVRLVCLSGAGRLKEHGKPLNEAGLSKGEVT